MEKEIHPSDEQLAYWTNNFVPEKDIFYVQEEDLQNLKSNLKEVLVIPEREFFQHDSYRQIQIQNSYIYWQRSKKIAFVIVADPCWVTELPTEKKTAIFGKQVNLNRGLVLSASFFHKLNDIPKDHIVTGRGEQVVVLQRDMWEKLSLQAKAHILREYAKEWDDGSCYELPEQAPSHLQNVANTFPKFGGANCMAAVLYAVTGHEWILHEWIHPETFAESLKKGNYARANEGLSVKDIVTWENEEGVIQHAAYHIGDNLFFNKNGQTFFNPWKIVNGHYLDQNWQHLKRQVYRSKVEQFV